MIQSLKIDDGIEEQEPISYNKWVSRIHCYVHIKLSIDVRSQDAGSCGVVHHQLTVTYNQNAKREEQYKC